MYRQHARPGKPPTLIEYRTRWFRPWFLVIGLCVFVAGLVAVGGLHATRLSCARDGEESGSCHVRRYALVESLDLDISTDHIARLDVHVRSGSKGGQYAELRLVTTPSSGYGIIDVESGIWGHIDPGKARNAQARIDAFKVHGLRGFEMWLTPGLGNLALVLLSVAILTMGVVMLRDQLRQLRPIRIVVDHAREVVVVSKREIPFNEIDDITVELGRAHYWASRKNEYIPGHRIVVVRNFGDDIPATKDFRAGERGVHDGARKALLRALGRAPRLERASVDTASVARGCGVLARRAFSRVRPLRACSTTIGISDLSRVPNHRARPQCAR